ncbi:hypothetical protein KAR48_00225 [bacterium]|nr:hypothetical protein [bacterium]
MNAGMSIYGILIFLTLSVNPVFSQQDNRNIAILPFHSIEYKDIGFALTMGIIH